MSASSFVLLDGTRIEIGQLSLLSYPAAAILTVTKPSPPPEAPSSVSSPLGAATSSSNCSSPADAHNTSLSDDNRVCLICGDRSDGAHFGVDACRACAAFFRRSIVLKKKYVCRQGGHACSINKAVRSMCRKCRFVKCLQRGMLPENVKAKPKSSASSTPKHRLEQPSRTASAIDSAESSVELPLHPQLRIEDDKEASTSADIKPQLKSLNPSPDRGMPRLMQIHRCYTQLCLRRRSIELALQSDRQPRGLRQISKEESYRLVTFPVLSRIMKSWLPITAEFCASAFPEFVKLEQHEQLTVFHDFFIALWNAENFVNTLRAFPDEEHCNKKSVHANSRATSITTYINLEEMEQFFTDMPDGFDMQKSSEYTREGVFGDTGYVLRMLHRVKLTDVEFCALIAISMMFPPYHPKGHRKLVDLSLGVRTEILAELHTYYSCMQRKEDYAVRLGDVMTLSSTLQKTAISLADDMEIFKLFDAFAVDPFLYEITHK